MKKPNILWIMTDQHKHDAFSFRGGKKGLTENLDRLAEDSHTFSNCYCPSPVCGPARSSMKTGLFPPENGVIGNWIEFDDGINFLPKEVENAGYETGMAGKLHFWPPERDYGFQSRWLSDAPYDVYADDPDHSAYIAWLRDRFAKDGKTDPVELFNADERSYDDNIKRFIMGSDFRTVEEHETNWTTERTLEFLKNRNEDKPFFFYCSYFGPHQPYCPPEPYRSWMSEDEIELPDSYYNDYKKDSEVFNHTARTTWNHLRKNLSEDDVKNCIAAYMGQVKMIDDSIGRIMDYLKENNLYDDTLIIFSSDHGDHLAEHGLFFKTDMYDSCAKVPLIIKMPGRHKAFDDDRIVNTIDLYKTILDITGARDLNDSRYSRSLLPIMEDEKAEWQNETYSIIGNKPEKALTMLRKEDFKLIRYPGGYYELYNLKEDSREINDLWKSMEDDEEIISLRKQLDDWSESMIGKYPAK